jgi:hypothetical protein
MESKFPNVPPSPSPKGEKRTNPSDPGPRERRRERWSEFRHAYPGVLAAMGFAFLVLLVSIGFLGYKRMQYGNEIDRLRSGMSDVERQRTDALLADETQRLKVMLELIRRQSLADRTLHIAVSVDSGLMHLSREGARLRDMEVVVGGERGVSEGAGADSLPITVPRGTRTVERILSAGDAWEVPAWVYQDRGIPAPSERRVAGALGPVALVLSGGAIIYSMPQSGPLSDSVYVMPGSIRARAEDLRAVLPNLERGMRVYFY